MDIYSIYDMIPDYSTMFRVNCSCLLLRSLPAWRGNRLKDSSRIRTLAFFTNLGDHSGAPVKLTRGEVKKEMEI